MDILKSGFFEKLQKSLKRPQDPKEPFKRTLRSRNLSFKRASWQTQNPLRGLPRNAPVLLPSYPKGFSFGIPRTNLFEGSQIGLKGSGTVRRSSANRPQTIRKPSANRPQTIRKPGARGSPRGPFAGPLLDYKPL